MEINARFLQVLVLCAARARPPACLVAHDLTPHPPTYHPPGGSACWLVCGFRSQLPAPFVEGRWVHPEKLLVAKSRNTKTFKFKNHGGGEVQKIDHLGLGDPYPLHNMASNNIAVMVRPPQKQTMSHPSMRHESHGLVHSSMLNVSENTTPPVLL